MSDGHLKTRQKNSTKLYEACERCGKPKSGNFGSTITRWVFKLDTCECKPNAAGTSHALAAPELPKPDTNRSSDANRTEQPSETSIDLGDRYEIIELIGQGGMGTVYRVRDKVLEKEFAVKVLRDDFATDPSAIERFKQEADAASDLTHPNMLATYGRGSTASGAHYIVMDFLEGESLSQILKRETRLDATRVIDISTQICDALAHAHMKSLIHRDLKPSNIMLTGEESVAQTVKVLDFGIAKLKATSNRETQNLTETGDLFGSPSYMSPEQCLGFAVDARSDIYSLGCMMYEMLSGQPPFAGKNPIQTVIQHLNDEPLSLSKVGPTNPTTARLQAIIMRCLEKNSAQRYQSMDQVKADLQLVAAGKLPKQAKKRTLKQIPLSWPVVSTLVLAGGAWVSFELLALTGFNAAREISYGIAVAGFLFSFICASLWCAVLGQACWKKVRKVRSGSAELHEKWLAAALVSLTTCVFPATAWFYTFLFGSECLRFLHSKGWLILDQYFFSHGPLQMLSIFILVLSNVAIFLTFLAALGWALTRAAHALKLPRARQKLIGFLYVGLLGLFAILGYRNLAWVPYTLGNTFTGSWDSDGRPDLDLAIAINPDFAKAYYDRGCSKAVYHEPSAMTDFNKAIAVTSDKHLKSQAYIERSKLYAAAGETSKAMNDLEQATALNPNPRRGRQMILASYLKQSKQYDKAIAIYNKIIEANPNASVYQQRSEAYLKNGDLKPALADIDSALIWEQNRLSYFIQRANIYEQLGQLDLAQQDYTTVTKRDLMGLPRQGNDSTELRSIGIAYQKLGYADEAKKKFATAADIERRSGVTNSDKQQWEYDY